MVTFGRMKNLLCAFAIATTLIGCSGPKAQPAPTPADTVAKESESIQPTKAASVVFHGDVDFTTQEREAIWLSAEMWSIQTSGLAQIRVVFDAELESPEWTKAHANDNLLGRFTSDMRIVRKHDEDPKNQGGRLMGQVSPAGGIHNPWKAPLRMFLVMDTIDDNGPEALVSTTIHEFGHVLGVPHVQAVQAVMYPVNITHKHQCLKQPDLTAFCGVNDCGTKKMHPCE